jgi:hypothetical protein
MSLALFRRFVHRVGLIDLKFDREIHTIYSSLLLHQAEGEEQVRTRTHTVNTL